MFLESIWYPTGGGMVVQQEVSGFDSPDLPEALILTYCEDMHAFGR